MVDLNNDNKDEGMMKSLHFQSQNYFDHSDL